jgi:folate-binding Fe-S cluster repair protein YgfZ
MARLKSMGRVRRRLLRVRGDGDALPVLPARVFVGGRNVGELRSAVRDGGGGWIGLAMISLMYVVAGAKLSFAPDAPTAITLVDTP